MRSYTRPDHNHMPDADDAAPNGLPAARTQQITPYVTTGIATPSAPGYYETEAEGLNIAQILSIFLRHRKLMLTTFVVVLLGTFLFTWLQRPIYQSTATILINTDVHTPTGAKAEELSALSEIMSNAKAHSLATQIEVMGGSIVREGALHRLPPELRDSAKEFHNAVLTPVGDTDIVAISVTSYNPLVSSKLADAISDEYMAQSKIQNQAEMTAATKYLKDQLTTVHDQLSRAYNALKAYRQQYGIVDISQETQQVVGLAAAMESGLRGAQTDYAGAQAQLSALRGVAARTPTHVIQTTTVRRSIVEALRAQLTKLELERLEAGQEYTPSSAKIQNIDGQIRSIKDRLAHEPTSEIGGSQQEPNPTYVSVQEAISKAESEATSMSAKIGTLQSQLESARARLSQLPEREYRMTQLSTNVKSLQATYAMLDGKYQTLRINQEAILSSARGISPANLPGSPISPQKGRNMMFGFFFGLILAVALAILMDTMDNRVHSEEDAEKATRLPVLAYVPNIRDKARQSLLGNTDRATPLLESYRMLRTNVAFAALTEPIHSILVTSSQPNEGKSYSSLNLAIATALSGKKVILVDSDLRRPSLHRLLGLSNERGFTSIATGACTIEEALQETQVPNLYFLSAGMRAPNPPELLDSEIGRNIFRQIYEIADFAVVDSPPGLIMADAQVLATIVDAAIVVVSAADTNTNDIARICDQLAQTGVKMLGTILTKLPENFGGYQGYYYNYRYNYKYYSHYFGSDDKPGSNNGSNGHQPAQLPTRNADAEAAAATKSGASSGD